MHDHYSRGLRFRPSELTGTYSLGLNHYDRRGERTLFKTRRWGIDSEEHPLAGFVTERKHVTANGRVEREAECFQPSRRNALSKVNLLIRITKSAAQQRLVVASKICELARDLHNPLALALQYPEYPSPGSTLGPS